VEALPRFAQELHNLIGRGSRKNSRWNSQFLPASECPPCGTMPPTRTRQSSIPSLEAVALCCGREVLCAPLRIETPTALHILLYRSGGNHLQCLPQASIDHFHFPHPRSAGKSAPRSMSIGAWRTGRTRVFVFQTGEAHHTTRRRLVLLRWIALLDGSERGSS